MTRPRTGLPLPHAYPFLLLDRVVEVRPGVSATAVRNVTHGDPLLGADGFLAPVLLAEVIAQCAGLAVTTAEGGISGVLARVDRFRGRTCVAAGDRLEVSVRVLRTFGATVKARGIVRVKRRICAAGDVVLQLARATR